MVEVIYCILKMHYFLFCELQGIVIQEAKL